MVEIGCGDGSLLAALKEQRQARVKGYDVSVVAVQKARAKGVDAEVRDAITHGLQDGDKPDYVIIADCLEHLPNPEALLERLRGQTNKAILISIPNSCYWRYRFRVLFGSFMVQWVAHPGEHLRFWSISDMRWWLNQLGFEARRSYATWGIPLLKRIWPSMFAQNVLYVVKEKNAADPSCESSASAPTEARSTPRCQSCSAP
ncbi:MAG: class I SAM-dependent methyltransferase [Gemmataceae bacterium]|nr:class I SAM-dependent methyltransferase [Gemmataceae bacterium]MCI0743383.1 class I SAM-dependent methyltransferase [Gemmataceae bacterium]